MDSFVEFMCGFLAAVGGMGFYFARRINKLEKEIQLMKEAAMFSRSARRGSGYQ